MKYLEHLRSQVVAADARHAAALATLDAIAEAVESSETRSATPEQDAEFAAAEAEARAAKEAGDALRQRLAEMEQVAERASAASGLTFISKTNPTEAQDARSMSAPQMVDAITRAIEARDIDPDSARKVLKRHQADRAWAENLLTRSSELYARAWSKVITGRQYELDEQERSAIAVGTNAQGGFLVPTFLDPTVILTNNGTVNAIRNIARVETMTVGNVWQGITSAGVTASWDAELSEVSNDTPQDFARPSVSLFTGRAFAQVSYEALGDIENLASDVARMLADARDRLEATAHCTGSGTGQPWGIFSALDANTNVEITSTTAATIGLVDLQALKRAVPVRFRGAGTWVMAPVYADAIKALGTAVSASFSNDITGANTNLLLGRPVVETDDAPTTQTTTVRDNEIVYGDFSNYVIADKAGSASVTYIPTLFNTANNLPDGRSGWLLQWRSGADSVNDLAFRLLQDRTSA